jgi:hypothetical protein
VAERVVMAEVTCLPTLVGRGPGVSLQRQGLPSRGYRAER